MADDADLVGRIGEQPRILFEIHSHKLLTMLCSHVCRFVKFNAKRELVIPLFKHRLYDLIGRADFVHHLVGVDE